MKNRKFNPEKPVEVYFNLHRKVFSVRQSGIVWGHAHKIYLRDCEYKVGEKGRQRVLAEKRKNVHAFVKGKVANLLGGGRPWNTITERELRYNPYKGPHFTDSEGRNYFKTSHCEMFVDENKKPHILV